MILIIRYEFDPTSTVFPFFAKAYLPAEDGEAGGLPHLWTVACGRDYCAARERLLEKVAAAEALSRVVQPPEETITIDLAVTSEPIPVAA